MFTGLIQTVGEVKKATASGLEVLARIPKPSKGESIAIDGVCLTVTKMVKAGAAWRLSFDVSPETIERTTFSEIRAGSRVNVERCATLNTLLGGHLVQGHVDGTGIVKIVRPAGDGKEIYFAGPSNILDYAVPKGSIAVNGVSLTVVNIDHHSFSVALVPHTLKETNLGNLKMGDRVNLEIDVLAKYVEKLINKRKDTGSSI